MSFSRSVFGVRSILRFCFTFVLGFFLGSYFNSQQQETNGVHSIRKERIQTLARDSVVPQGPNIPKDPIAPEIPDAPRILPPAEQPAAPKTPPPLPTLPKEPLPTVDPVNIPQKTPSPLHPVSPISVPAGIGVQPPVIGQTFPSPPAPPKGSDHSISLLEQELFEQYKVRSLQELIKRVPSMCSGEIEKFSWKSKSNLPGIKSDPFDQLYSEINSCQFYNPESNAWNDVIKSLATQRIVSAELPPSGTQIKFVLTFENGFKAMMKPLRYDVSYESGLNHFQFSDFERANAEIAGFHLDRVLKFYRAPPTAGRVIDLRDLENICESELKKSFFKSLVNNTCVAGVCKYYCDTTHAICGAPHHILASIQMYFPDPAIFPLKRTKSPYRRSYSRRNHKADFQTEENYCTSTVLHHPAFAKDNRRLLDLVDLHIYDYLMGNIDRHHVNPVDAFSKPAYEMIFDNGRGFGKSWSDTFDILAPLYQCCVIRPSTLAMLLGYYRKVPDSLSNTFRKALQDDVIQPVLADKHFDALERRLENILKLVASCVADTDDIGNVVRTTVESDQDSEGSFRDKVTKKEPDFAPDFDN